MLFSFSIGQAISMNQSFSKNFIENRSRYIILSGYPNKKRRFHFLYKYDLLKKKTNYYLKLRQWKLTKFFEFIILVIFSIYSIIFFINQIEVISISFIFIKEKIFNFTIFIILLFSLVLFFSKRKVETRFLNKITLFYIYLNSILITEKCILLSGAENTWILFKIISTCIIYKNLWEGKNNILKFSFSSEKENKILWQIKTSFLVVFSLDFINKILITKYFKFFLDEISNFPNFLLSLIICLKKEKYSYILTNFWLFSTLGYSLMLITCLIFLYYVAFVKIKKNIEILPMSFKTFLLKKSIKTTKKLLPANAIASSISNLNSSDAENQNTIEILLLSEKGNINSTKIGENSRWKIKRKGIKTPFPETVRNNELPILKQNLWYEIKSR